MHAASSSIQSLRSFLFETFIAFFCHFCQFCCQTDEVSSWQKFNIAGKKKTNYWEQKDQCNVREFKKTFAPSTDTAASVFYWFRASEVFTDIPSHLCSHWSACAVTPNQLLLLHYFLPFFWPSPLARKKINTAPYGIIHPIAIRLNWFYWRFHFKC